MRSSMAVLRPSSGYPSTRPEQEAHLERAFDSFHKDLTNLMHAADHNSPFYPAEIYTLLDQLIRAAQTERDDILYNVGHDRFDLPWFSRGRSNHTQYLALVEKVDLAIRNRLEKLAVRGLGPQ